MSIGEDLINLKSQKATMTIIRRFSMRKGICHKGIIIVAQHRSKIDILAIIIIIIGIKVMIIMESVIKTGINSHMARHHQIIHPMYIIITTPITKSSNPYISHNISHQYKIIKHVKIFHNKYQPVSQNQTQAIPIETNH